MLRTTLKGYAAHHHFTLKSTLPKFDFLLFNSPYLNKAHFVPGEGGGVLPMMA